MQFFGLVMTASSVTNLVLLAHRWVGLVLAPLFLLVLLSGTVLAFKPIVEDFQTSTTVDPNTLVALLDRVDARGRVRSISVGDGTAILEMRGGDHIVSYDLASGLAISTPTSFNLFSIAKRFHKGLLLGLDVLGEFAAYAMLLIVVTGPFLAWPRFRNTLLGWHLSAGWVLLPLVLLPPATAVLMTLHVGHPVYLPLSPRPISLARGIEQAAAAVDLSGFKAARSFRHGSVLITTKGASGGDRYYLSTSEGVISTDGPGPVHAVHEGTWAGTWSGTLNLAAALALLGLVGTGVVSWAQRWRQSARLTSDADADILVAFASQTGTAARLADATSAALRAGGAKIVSGSLAAIDPAELTRFRVSLFLVSTAGEGEPPDQACPFLKKLAGRDLSGVRFALLALGDSRYARFCGGGETVRAALLKSGAIETLDLMRADREPGEVWRRWLDVVSKHLGIAQGDVVTPAFDHPVTLTLASRVQLNDPNNLDTNEAWSLLFESAEPLDFRAGDLLMVSPRDSEPERAYSIGSSALVDPHQILLTVGLISYTDEQGNEQLGAMSGILCRRLRAGDIVQAKLRRHVAFNLPGEPDRPVLMLATGCGIAPFVGFLSEHATAHRTGVTWLIFGNRKRAGDFFYRERLENWAQNGVLSRLDTAFSRDPEDGAYVQDRLVESGAETLRLLERGGILYVCGRASTIGTGVRTALQQILAREKSMQPTEAEAHLERWQGEGVLRLDVFD
jgi:sulfite reductase (NADPH) flavoprotein alpha-component